MKRIMSKFCLECQKAGPKDTKRLSKRKAGLLTNIYFEKIIHCNKIWQNQISSFSYPLLFLLGRGFLIGFVEDPSALLKNKADIFIWQHLHTFSVEQMFSSTDNKITWTLEQVYIFSGLRPWWFFSPSMQLCRFFILLVMRVLNYYLSNCTSKSRLTVQSESQYSYTVLRLNLWLATDCSQVE